MSVVFIGAGSTVFFKTVFVDTLHYENLRKSEIVLYDIDPERVKESLNLAERLTRKRGLSVNIRIGADLDDALRGADFVLCMFQIGGLPATTADFEIPRQFGLRQTIADTLGIGGIMRALRTIPELLKVARAMEQHCPDALLINYVNPMAMCVWALEELGHVRTVGLCHSVPHTVGELCGDLQVPYDEVEYTVAGINHLAFFLSFTHRGVDLYPRLHEVYARQSMHDDNRTRYDLLNKFGYFVTESSEHLSEYVPWYIKPGREDLLEKYRIPLDEYLGRCEIQQRIWTKIQQRLKEEKVITNEELESSVSDITLMPRMKEGALKMYHLIDEFYQSADYGARILAAYSGGESSQVYCNVRNGSLIENLPEDCCVEVPCKISSGLIEPQKIGTLPVQLTALMQSNINVQQLVIEAVKTRNKDHIYHAALLDPHTAAVLDTDQIVAMVDQLLEVHKEFLTPLGLQSTRIQ